MQKAMMKKVEMTTKMNVRVNRVKRKMFCVFAQMLL